LSFAGIAGYAGEDSVCDHVQSDARDGASSPAVGMELLL
jgi:hypothetical protein